MMRSHHTHRCAEPGCTARVHCTGRPDDHGRCEEADAAHTVCEEHWDVPTCDWCGLREPQDFIDHDGDRMHPACARESEERTA